VTSEESVADAHEAVAAEVAAGNLPAVGALANIAGITSPVPFLDTTLELWNTVMAVNATGTYLVTKAFLPGMLEARWGRIVNMSSVSAQRGGGVFGKVPYSAAKAAILGFTKALAREIADTGVTVNAVTPGAVDTNIRLGSTDEQEAKLAGDIPIGRTATTDEVAAVITFLSSDDASYLPAPPSTSTAAATFTRPPHRSRTYGCLQGLLDVSVQHPHTRDRRRRNGTGNSLHRLPPRGAGAAGSDIDRDR
jgi:2-hydroxycyclohexanecarboxyl-CoA dehydrogenase